MFDHLQISDPRERRLVGLADAVLGVAAGVVRLVSGRRRTAGNPSRILLLRLERIGDLLMAADAICAVRELAPRATVTLVSGSWNQSIATLLAGVDRVETVDAPWLARGRVDARLRRALSAARTWRVGDYDLAINFEGDIRSNLLLALSGASRRVGFGMAGGGSLLTDVVAYDPRLHAGANALRLVERAFDLPNDELASRLSAGNGPRLVLPDAAATGADALLASVQPGTRSPGRPLYVGLHPGGDRLIKRWAPARFAGVGRLLARRYDATVVLTGSESDRAATAEVARLLGGDVQVLDLAGRTDLLTLAALLRRMLVFVTGDTGPMHVAAALDVPLVGIFGPSDPARWGPLSPGARTVRRELPCSPCNRIRRPPARCVGHVPDCLAGVEVGSVYAAAVAAIEEQATPGAAPAADARAKAGR